MFLRQKHVVNSLMKLAPGMKELCCLFDILYCSNRETTYEGLQPDITSAQAYASLNQGNCLT